MGMPPPPDVDHRLGEVAVLEPEAQVGLVVAVARHRLGEAAAGEAPARIELGEIAHAGALEQPEA